jgi:serine/threonine-protein phosphatase 2A activator
MSKELPLLRQIPLAEVAGLKDPPIPRIRVDHDVEEWRATIGYQDYGLFLRRLNESVVGHQLPTGTAASSIQVRKSGTGFDELTNSVS